MQEGSLCTQFFVVKQEGSMAKFQKKFETYSALLLHLVDDVLGNTFLCRLHRTIRAEVINKEPVGLESIMKQTRLIDNCDLAVKLALESKESRLNSTASKTTQNNPNKSSDSLAQKQVNWEPDTMQLEPSYYPTRDWIFERVHMHCYKKTTLACMYSCEVK